MGQWDGWQDQWSSWCPGNVFACGSWAVVTGQLGEWLVGYKTPLLPSPGPSPGIWR